MTTERVVGPRVVGEVIGVGGGTDTDTIPEQVPAFAQLKGKNLGHIHNILFWNKTQQQLLRALSRQDSIVICGDYGGGKTSVLMAAAKQEAANTNHDIYFIP